jgi:peptidoglycan biosynthesis protein MviN/MurJ (putative lipid II flippase)
MKLKLRDPGGRATSWIILTITLILGVILVPIVVDQVQTTNTTDWTFTGYAGAKTLFLLLPFIFIIGIVVYFIGALLGKW